MRRARQAAGTPVMGREEHAGRFRLPVRDRDARFAAAFDAVFAAAGIEAPTIPARAPRADAYADRWVRAVRTECMDPILIRSTRQLHRVLTVYLHHDNAAGPHRRLDLRPPLEGSIPP